MNRRRFLGTLFGLAIVPAAVTRVISAPAPKPKYKVYKNPYGDMVMPYKGSQFLDVGYIYAPYIPLVHIPPCSSVCH